MFLDRDGVINHESSTYTRTPEDFRFYDGALEALTYLARTFKHVIVVTNQRGVGKGLMTEDDLLAIHRKMVQEVVASGGRIDQIYYCTSIHDDHPNRKPNPGMALAAMAEFPAIVAKKSIMVGNNLSDMEFGRNGGMYTVLLTTTGTSVQMPDPLVDLQCASLADFVSLLQRHLKPSTAPE